MKACVVTTFRVHGSSVAKQAMSAFLFPVIMVIGRGAMEMLYFVKKNRGRNVSGEIELKVVGNEMF